MAEMGPTVRPEHPLRHCAHIDWVDHYDANPRRRREQFKCPNCGHFTERILCNGGTRADTAYCTGCRREFAIVPTWQERLMELKAEKPGKILRDDSNAIYLTTNTSSTATNSITYFTLGTGNYGSNIWTIT